MMELALSLSAFPWEAPHLPSCRKLQIPPFSCCQVPWLGVLVLVVAISPSPAARCLHSTANFVILYFILISGQL